ncbi:MAG: NAD+ synthase [Euryarchaeota archaeon]|nr:NAD+ synthase [Euryarchaeota archaeon]
MNPHHARDTIAAFIRARISESSASGAVIGLSGGIDSAVVAHLAVEAVGKENVLAIMLPVQDLTPGYDTDDAIDVANRLGIEYRVIEVGDVLHGFSDSIPDYDPDAVVASGNLTARIRMCVLYYYANLMNRLVVGTGNRTELLLGYATKHGDAGVDLEPIGDLYKTEVFELAGFLGVPERIIRKAPSARLWAGQTDEGELGMRYPDIDRILRMLVDEQLSVDGIEARGVPGDAARRLINLISISEHKRHPPQNATVRGCGGGSGNSDSNISPDSNV